MPFVIGLDRRVEWPISSDRDLGLVDRSCDVAMTSEGIDAPRVDGSRSAA
jgi:hypothetical protein